MIYLVSISIVLESLKVAFTNKNKVSYFTKIFEYPYNSSLIINNKNE